MAIILGIIHPLQRFQTQRFWCWICVHRQV
jgi:hypothetical protein